MVFGMRRLLMKNLFSFGSILFALLLTMSFPSLGQARSSWFEKYQKIDDRYALTFMNHGFDYAKGLFGAPRRKVAKIYLRLSIPLNPKSGFKSNFQLTESTDPKEGIYTIYVSSRPGEYAFFGQLAHEVCHLLNPNLYDAYGEGICTAFAEKYILLQGKDWRGWLENFRQGNGGFYGATYFMMREIWGIVGDAHIKELLTNTRTSSQYPSKMYLDLNHWLATLPEDGKKRVLRVISHYRGPIELQIMRENKPVLFAVPEAG